MPRKLRREKMRRESVSPSLVAYFCAGRWPTDSNGQQTAGLLSLVFLRSDAALRADWQAVRDDVLASWVVDHPGTRPWAWWAWDAPRWRREDWPERCQDLGDVYLPRWAEPRRRLGGLGTPVFECMNYVPAFASGVPSSWVSAFDVLYYPDFEGLAPDPNDPPKYESQAAYLQRHGLLLPGELKRLDPADFEPELVTVAPG